MKINVYRSASPRSIALVAMLHYFFGEGVTVETYTRPVLNANDLRTLAGALLTAADGLSHGDEPEQVRSRIEQAQPLMQTIEISEHDRIVMLNGVVFRLHCTWQTIGDGSWGWMTQRPGQPIRISGSADTLDGGFERALEVALNWDANISATLGAPAPDEEPIDPAAPEYQPTRLGIVEPAIDLEGDTLPLEPVAAPEADIPPDVIEALIIVRDSAVTNMLDRARVMTAMEDAGYLGSAVWVEENPNQYMDALNKMGRVTSRRDEPRDEFPGFPGNYF